MDNNKIVDLSIILYDDHMSIGTLRENSSEITYETIEISPGDDIQLDISTSSDLSEVERLFILNLRTGGTVTVDTDQFCSLPETVTSITLSGLHLIINRPECIISTNLRHLQIDNSTFEINAPNYDNILQMVYDYQPNIRSVVIINTNMVGPVPDWDTNSIPNRLILRNNEGVDDVIRPMNIPTSSGGIILGTQRISPSTLSPTGRSPSIGSASDDDDEIIRRRSDDIYY